MRGERGGVAVEPVGAETVIYFAHGQRAGERPHLPRVASHGDRHLRPRIRRCQGLPDCPARHDRLENKDLYSTVGVLIVLSGAALVVVGYLQHARVWRLLRGEAPKPRWPLAMTVTSFVGSLVLAVLIVVSS